MKRFWRILAGLLLAGWRWGDGPDSQLLAVASGTAFAAIAIGQMANAVACRSTTRPVWRLRPLDNPLVLSAIGAELVLRRADDAVEVGRELRRLARGQIDRRGRRAA